MKSYQITESHRRLLRAALVIEALHIMIFLMIPLLGWVGLLKAQDDHTEGFVLILTLSVPLVLFSFVLLVFLLINHRNYKRLKAGRVSKRKAENIFTFHLVYGIIIGFFFALFLIGIPYVVSYTKRNQSLNS